MSEREPVVSEHEGVQYVDGSPPWRLEPHKANWLIAEYEIGGATFRIYGSRPKTLAEAERILQDRQTLIKAYSYLTGDTRLALPFNACFRAMMQEIQVKWFEFNGFEVPRRVASALEESMAKAQSTAPAEEQETSTTTKEPRVTNRSIIEAGLLAGTPDEEILAQVKERFPEGKADMKHIAYYRHFLVKAGKLEAQPRKSRKKAEAAEQAPEPAKAAAKPAARAAAAPAPKAVATKAAPAPKAAAKR